MLLTILPKLHVGVPSLKKTQNVSYLFKFKAWEYDIDKDQDDWNKLTGLKSKFFSPTEEAYMIAWRWYKGKLQLAPYINQDNKFILPTEDEIITLDNPEDSFTAEVYVGGDNVIMRVSTTNSNKYLVTKTAKFNVKPKWEVSFWFGGNRLPNKTIQVYRWVNGAANKINF